MVASSVAIANITRAAADAAEQVCSGSAPSAAASAITAASAAAFPQAVYASTNDTETVPGRCAFAYAAVHVQLEDMAHVLAPVFLEASCACGRVNASLTTEELRGAYTEASFTRKSGWRSGAQSALLPQHARRRGCSLAA